MQGIAHVMLDLEQRTLGGGLLLTLLLKLGLLLLARKRSSSITSGHGEVCNDEAGPVLLHFKGPVVVFSPLCMTKTSTPVSTKLGHCHMMVWDPLRPVTCCGLEVGQKHMAASERYPEIVWTPRTVPENV